MKFVWEDDYERALNPGNKIVGLRHHGKRPVELKLDYNDIREFLLMDNLKEYLYAIAPSLAIKDQV